MRTVAAISSTATATAGAGVPSPSPEMRSPWHSPVPYLFGGLAAMLGLIAFALLILACSYWRLSEERDDDDLESGVAADKGGEKVAKVYEEKILVIMAGHDTPTFLATPVCSRASSFGVDARDCDHAAGDAQKTEHVEKSKAVTSYSHSLDQQQHMETSDGTESRDQQEHHQQNH